MSDQQTIINEAREWINTPFHHQGRVKQVGVDCIGLVQQVGKKLGYVYYDRSDYAREPAKGELQQAMNNHLVKLKSLEPACILLMRFAREPQHVAFFTEKNTIIHAYESIGKCVEHRLDDKWKKRIVAIYGFEGVEWLNSY